MLVKMNSIFKVIEDSTADKITSCIQQITRYPYYGGIYTFFVWLPVIIGVGAMRIKNIHAIFIMDIMSEPEHPVIFKHFIGHFNTHSCGNGKTVAGLIVGVN